MKTTPDRSSARDFASCPCMGVNLPKLVQPLILASLAGGPMHGYAITERIAGHDLHAKGPPDHSAVYRLLRAMEKRGMVTARLVESSAGPARREYALTASGRKCLGLWMKSLAGHRGTIESIMALCKDAGRA